MNFHWGYKAAVFYLAFVAFILFLVGKAVNQNFDLVNKDYYQNDLTYQEQIDRKRNAKSLEIPLEIKFSKNSEQLTLQFPTTKKNISGEIQLYKPNKATQDHILDLSVNTNGKQLIDMQSYGDGLWRVKVIWSSDGIDYFDESVFVKQ